VKLWDIFLTASSNLFRAKLRTTLTIIAIFIGAFTLTITSGIGAGISAYINQQLGNLGAKNVLIVMPADSAPGQNDPVPKKYDPAKTTSAAGGFRDSATVMTQTDLDKIKKQNGINSVTPMLPVAADYISGKNPDKYQVTVSPNIRGTNLDLASGHDVDDSTAGYQVVLPISFVEILGFGSADNAVGETVTFGISNALGKQVQQTATIVGIQQKSIIGGGGAIINHALTEKLYDLQSTGLPAATKGKYQIAEAVFDSNLTTEQVDKLKSDLKSQGYLARTVQDQIGTFKTVIAAIINVLNAFAVIALLAASFGIINTLLMAVQERTKEIGLMKSMGMGSGRIFLLFSAEAVMIGFWGSLLGVVVAYGVGNLADRILSHGFLKDLPGLHIVSSPATSPGATPPLKRPCLPTPLLSPATSAALHGRASSVHYSWS
jgi:putative ABC transport system permease protein